MLLNCSDLLVSKPGGSLTAEVLETETPIYLYGLNKGEEENASYLLRSGLAVLHQDSEALSTVINDLLNGRQVLELNPNFKLPDWRNSITSMLVDLGVPIPNGANLPHAI